MENSQKFCGNCDGHNCYDYPTKIFCSTRYAQNKNPIVDTLWCCSDWSQVSQDCYCVQEAKKAKEATTKQR
ncbi:MAG: hypothetical protein NWF05_07585 [Candidatus Bathyarchaeota archaeon]|nr:hypothetical protein [Candidatus Bathyarchaeota archaeon]